MRTHHFICGTILLMVALPTVQLRSGDLHTGEQRSGFVPRWAKDAIFYQIFPERFANGEPSNDPPGTEPWGGLPKTKNYFGGDLQGIVKNLDYISSLGVNTLYLNPIFQSNSNHKYHADDYLNIDSAFGNEYVFRNLVNECHARGLRIILDGVFNHSGTGLFAFQDIKVNGAKSKCVKWYNIYSFPVGPPNKPNYECWWGYGDLPKLMTQNPEVREYLFRVTRHWMEHGIDGWRLDVPNEVPHEFWVEWRALVKSINPEAYIVGEIWDDARPWLHGDQFDAVMNYKFRDACLDFFVHRKSTAAQFDSALARLRSMYPDEVNFAMQNLLGSHDTERLLTLCAGDKEMMKLAWLFQMTYVGAPMVYYGDEVGMMGGKDPGCRGTMVWDAAQQDKDLLDCMKDLIKMRRENPVLRQGTFKTLIADSTTGLFAFVRKDGSASAIVVLNNSRATQSFSMKLSEEEKEVKWIQAWPGTGDGVMIKQNNLQLRIPAGSGVVLLGGEK